MAARLTDSDVRLNKLDLPKELRWSDQQIDRSLKETIRNCPDPREIWVFAYGSLMWNPKLTFDRRQVATLTGWHRSFCIRAVAGRGSVQKPGRMLGLEPGGTTDGLALRLDARKINEELRLLWEREMVAGSYRPIWAPITLNDGVLRNAIIFVADPSRPQYEEDSSIASVAPLVAVAEGVFGSNAQYVFELDAALSDCGLADPYVRELAVKVRFLATTS